MNWVEVVWGALRNHRAIVPERDKDVPNKHNPHALSWSDARLRYMCVFACAFEQM